MKKILYIHQYFKTPDDGGCIRSYHLAKGLIAAGYQITMITAHNEGTYQKKIIQGIHVHYLPVAYDNSFGFIKRVRSFLKFFMRAISLAGKEKDAQLAYVTTTPLTTALIALYLKFFKRIPYYFEVGDLWPEVPVKMGLLKNPLLKSAAYLLEELAYKNASKLVALSPGIAGYMARKQPGKPLEVIPNMSDMTYFQPTEKDSSNQLKILYCGAIGVANHLEYLLDAARICHEQKLPVSFTIIGAGGRREAIAKLAEELPNVEMKDFTNRAGLKPIVDAHDAFYVSFSKVDVLHTGSPNKYFDGLAAGKLMILNLGGWLKDLTEMNHCGFAYDPELPLEFVEKIMPYLQNENLLIQAQENSLRLAREYSVFQAQKKLVEFINGN
ncbi:MAG: glycosyltransferase family 4 protein [Bacteroidota bacterium]